MPATPQLTAIARAADWRRRQTERADGGGTASRDKDPSPVQVGRVSGSNCWLATQLTRAHLISTSSQLSTGKKSNASLEMHLVKSHHCHHSSVIGHQTSVTYLWKNTRDKRHEVEARRGNYQRHVRLEQAVHEKNEERAGGDGAVAGAGAEGGGRGASSIVDAPHRTARNKAADCWSRKS